MDKLNKLIRNKQYYSIYQSSLICYEADKIFKQFFKNYQIKILSFNNHILKIKTANPFEANDLRNKKNQILELLNNKINKTKITRISIN